MEWLRWSGLQWSGCGGGLRWSGLWWFAVGGGLRWSADSIGVLGGGLVADLVIRLLIRLDLICWWVVVCDGVLGVAD